MVDLRVIYWIQLDCLISNEKVRIPGRNNQKIRNYYEKFLYPSDCLNDIWIESTIFSCEQ